MIQIKWKMQISGFLSSKNPKLLQTHLKQKKIFIIPVKRKLQVYLAFFILRNENCCKLKWIQTSNLSLRTSKKNSFGVLKINLHILKMVYHHQLINTTQAEVVFKADVLSPQNRKLLQKQLKLDSKLYLKLYKQHYFEVLKINLQNLKIGHQQQLII